MTDSPATPAEMGAALTIAEAEGGGVWSMQLHPTAGLLCL
jgi:hypothetical protein